MSELTRQQRRDRAFRGCVHAFFVALAAAGVRLQTSVAVVDYVHDRTQAEVQVLITHADTAAGGVEYGSRSSAAAASTASPKRSGR